MQQQSDLRDNKEEQIRRRDFINDHFRFADIENATDTTDFYKASMLYFFKDEVIADALYRKVMYFNEACSVILYSSYIPLGSGKSNNALQLALDVDPNFDIEKQLFFSGKEFLKAVKSVKPGQALIWDEAGVGGGGSRDWRSEVNQELTEMMRLARFRKPFLFFVTPSPSLIDVNVRVLCGIEFESIGVNQGKKESYAVCRAMRWKKNRYGVWELDQTLPRQVDWDGSVRTVVTTSFYNMKELHPTIWDRYEERKKEFLFNGSKKEEDENEIEHLKTENAALRGEIGRLKGAISTMKLNKG